MCPNGEIFVSVGLFYRMWNDPSLLLSADTSDPSVKQRGVSRVHDLSAAHFLKYPAELLVLFEGIHRVFCKLQMNGAGESISADEAVESGFAVQEIFHIDKLQQELFILRF